VVNCLPSPDEEHARKAINPSSGEEIMVEMAGCDGLPLKAIVFKTLTDPYTGRISIFRVFHGKIASDDTVNVFGKDGKQTKERFGKLAKIRGKKQESFDEIYAAKSAAWPS
jgi:elongation factor G